MNPGQEYFNVYKKRIYKTIKEANGIVDNKYISLVERGINKFDEVIKMMKDQLDSGKFLHLFMNATPLQQAMFMLTIAWVHLWSLIITIPKMKELIGNTKGEDRDRILEENMEAAYYSGRVLSAQFFIGAEFPKFFGNIEAILFGETAVIKAKEHVFTGMPSE